MMNDPYKQRLYYAQNSTNFCSLSGITNISIAKNISYADSYSLGGVCSPLQINAPTQVEINLEFDLVQRNDFLQYTGVNSICFNIFNGSNYVYVPNLYLDSYSAQFTVGSIPKVNAKFVSYFGEIINSSAPTTIIQNPFSIEIPNLNSICLSGLTLSTNGILNNQNIYSFTYSANSKRCVFYDTNITNPDVILIMPIVTSATINSKFIGAAVDESTVSTINPTRTLNFYIVNSNTTSTGIFPITNSSLISSDFRYSSSNFLELKRDYLGYYGI